MAQKLKTHFWIIMKYIEKIIRRFECVSLRLLGIKKDSRWNAWGYDEKQFLNIVSAIEFHAGVSTEVVNRFLMVKRLIMHSFFEYEFLDIAFERSLTTFEMALKIRYEEITKKNSEGKRLQALISWGAARNLFDKDEQFIQPLRHLRNYAAHPTHNSFMGFLAIEPTLRIVEIINAMWPKNMSS